MIQPHVILQSIHAAHDVHRTRMVHGITGNLQSVVESIQGSCGMSAKRLASSGGAKHSMQQHAELELLPQQYDYYDVNSCALVVPSPNVIFFKCTHMVADGPRYFCTTVW